MATEPKSTVFDFERYGVFLRTARQRAGFNRAEEFCRVVTNWIGVKINKEALYRIEKGVQPPTVEQLIAFGLVLFHGKGINSVLNKTDLHHCTTPYADFIAEREGSIYSMMTYNGYHAVDNPGNEDEPFWEPITAGMRTRSLKRMTTAPSTTACPTPSSTSTARSSTSHSFATPAL